MGKNVFVIEAQPDNWKEAIGETAQVLYDHGFVKSEFYDMCIKRELEFPTGLKTLLPVAIPHTSDGAVIDSAVCLLRLKKPVRFHNMENVDQEIDVDFVLNLAINSGGAQLKALQQIISIFQNPSFKENAQKLTLDELKQLFEDNWLIEETTED